MNRPYVVESENASPVDTELSIDDV
jgi:hypothetical protein